MSQLQKRNNLNCRKVTFEKGAQEMTGYPSIDKPWQKYYSEEALNKPLPECTLFEYVFQSNKDHLDNVALDYFGQKITYRTLFANIKQVAKAFVAQGIKRGDVVTVMSLITPETIYCIYALNYIGAIANMVYLSLSEDEIVCAVEQTGSKMLIALEVAREKVARIMHRVEGMKTVFLHINDSMPYIKRLGYGVTHRGDSTYKYFIRQGQSGTGEQAKYKRDMPALIVYTSGTTGHPKGVVLTNENLNSIAYQYRYCGVMFQENDTIMSFMPPFFAIGFSLNIHMPLCLGLKAVICVNPEPGNVTKEFLRIRPNHFIAAPSNIMQIVHNIKGDMSWCKSFGGGGECLPEDEVEEINRVLVLHNAKTKYIVGYGMSEFAATVCTDVMQECRKDSLGIPLCRTLAKVVAPDSYEEMSYGEIGELCFHTPSQMLHYLHNEHETKEIKRMHKDGMEWIHTGDLGWIDRDGFVYFKGRIKRIYMRKALDGTIYKIFPAQVEELLNNLKSIEKCAVIAVENADTLHDLIAFLVLSPKVKCTTNFISEINQYCKDNLPEHVVPNRYIVISELPLTQSGKIDYQALTHQTLVQTQ